MSDFFEDLSFGRLGEKKVIESMNAAGYIVIDVRDKEEYQKKDIDFIVNGKTFELKTDRKCASTGNMFLESRVFYNYTFEDKDGWFEYSEAEYLLYLDWYADVCYMYRMDDLRKVKDNYPQKCCNKDSYKSVYGYCIPLDAVPHGTMKLA
jgi:rhodanese-related sulfurtransferase